MARLLVLMLLLLVGLSEASASGPRPETTTDEILAAPGIDEPPLLDPPDAETAKARTKVIAHSLRCPVCQALSVADSSSDTARAMFHRIEGFVASGYSDEQIVDYFKDTYGDWVSLEPEKSGVGAVLWFLPIGVLVVGGLVIAARSKGTDPSLPAAVLPVVDTNDPYRQRILAELGEAPEVSAPPTAPPASPEETA